LSSFIDTSRQITETIDFSLSGVDALRSKDLRYVFVAIFERIGYDFSSGVDPGIPNSLLVRVLKGYSLQTNSSERGWKPHQLPSVETLTN